MTIIIKYDYTFWLHMLRDAVITLIIMFLHWLIVKVITGTDVETISLACSGFLSSIAFNLSWEIQDGLHNDGFNVIDFIGGLVGTYLIIKLYFFLIIKFMKVWGIE